MNDHREREGGGLALLIAAGLVVVMLLVCGGVAEWYIARHGMPYWMRFK